MYGTIIGIKVINLQTLMVSRLLGKVENGERFTKLALFQGAAKRDASLKGSGKDYSVQSDGTPMNDPTVMSAAVGSQRVYLFSTREPDEENGEGDDKEKDRDVYNEKPSLEEARNATGGKNGLGGANGSVESITVLGHLAHEYRRRIVQTLSKRVSENGRELHHALQKWLLRRCHLPQSNQRVHDSNRRSFRRRHRRYLHLGQRV